MSDNTFIPVPLVNDVIPEPIVEEVVVEPTPIEGIQPEDSRPKGDDYIPERIQYLKRMTELTTCGYAPVQDMAKLLIRDLDNYTRGEITISEIEQVCPEYPVEMDNEEYPNREYIIPYNYIRKKLLDLYKEEFGGDK